MRWSSARCRLRLRRKYQSPPPAAPATRTTGTTLDPPSSPSSVTSPPVPPSNGDPPDGEVDCGPWVAWTAATRATKSSNTACVPSSRWAWKAAVASAPARPAGRMLLPARKLSPATTA